MIDVVDELFTSLRRHEAELHQLKTAGGSPDTATIARLQREVSLCRRWLTAVGADADQSPPVRVPTLAPRSRPRSPAYGVSMRGR